MQVLDKVRFSPNICGVELGFYGQLKPSAIPEWQQFYNSYMDNIDFTKTYIGLASVSFEEQSAESAAGISYKQKISIRFPSTDSKRSERLILMQRVRFLKLKLTNGLDLVIGRNDYHQNARPKIKTESNIKMGEITFETVSITPAGFVANAQSYGLPTFIPITQH